MSGADGYGGGTLTFEPGFKGQAFSFDGQQSSVVFLPVNINPYALPRMTVGMLVKIRSTPNYQGWVFGHDNGGYDRSLNLHDSRYGANVPLSGVVAGGTGIDPHYSTLPLTLSEWHCVAASYNAYSGSATFYADGNSQTVFAVPQDGEPTASLGGLQNFGDHTVDALVDEVFMFDHDLSPVELDQVCAGFSNGAPDVSAAVPSISTIWPPNNKMVTVSILGLTDPDGDAVTVTITGISNNETGLADAAFSGSLAKVKATRNGKGSGRTYTISFIATDGNGGSTPGSVTVAVPHDQGH